MDISPENFISIDVILSDVLNDLEDSGFKSNSKGWYISQIQQSLEELSFDTYFKEVPQSFDVPENLRLPMPKGAFNLRHVYLFNGTECVIENSVNVFMKRNFINGKSGSGYVSMDKWKNEGDPFFPNRSGVASGNNSPNGLFYCSIQNGVIMLSESCRSFEKVMLVCNGVITDIGETPFIPQFFRQAVKDWVMVKALPKKMRESVGTQSYSHWVNMFKVAKSDLSDPYEGSWIKAERRVKSLNVKTRNDIKEYISRLNY